jgi:hypothetical protein
MSKYIIRNIDAWKEAEGGWTVNQSWNVGELEIADSDFTPRKVLKLLRDEGYLSDGSKGRVALDNMFGYPTTMVVNKNTREYLFELELVEDNVD